MNNKIKVNYISCWDGCEEITTSAKLNVDTGEVYDIEIVEVSDEYEILNGEFIEYDNGTIEQVKLKTGYAYSMNRATMEENILKTISDYFIISKLEDNHNVLELHGNKYIISNKLNKDDIQRILGIAK